MDHYLKTLQQEAKQANLHHQAEQRERAAAEATAARERVSLLDGRLRRVLANVPIEVQREGLSLMSLQTHFRGRSQDHMNCHVGEPGIALRRLRFRRERRWNKDADGFRALWYPPEKQ